MPRKKQTEPPEAQSKRFREAVRALEAAGELNPIEADEALDSVVRRSSSGESGKRAAEPSG